MAFDLSKIKGISDDVKAKLAKVKSRDEFDALVKAENLSAEQLKELVGGGEQPSCSWNSCPPDLDCLGNGGCFTESCRTLPWY